MLTYEEQIEIARKRQELFTKSRDEIRAIMKLSGFTVTHEWELANNYWPLNPSYDDVRVPWWLFMTDMGPIQVGWRAQVLSISWEATSVRGEVTEDNVTKSDSMVHAWKTEDAVKYLKALRALWVELVRLSK